MRQPLVAERSDEPVAGQVRRSGRSPLREFGRGDSRELALASGPRSREGPSAKVRARGVRPGHLAQNPGFAGSFAVGKIAADLPVAQGRPGLGAGFGTARSWAVSNSLRRASESAVWTRYHK